MKNHPLLIWFILIVIIVAAAAGTLQHNQQALAKEQRDRQHQQCLASVQGRQVLRELVMASTAGTQFDLTTLPAYARLDPASQEYFRELRDLQRSSTGPSAQLRQELLNKIPIPTCP